MSTLSELVVALVVLQELLEMKLNGKYYHLMFQKSLYASLATRQPSLQCPQACILGLYLDEWGESHKIIFSGPQVIKPA